VFLDRGKAQKTTQPKHNRKTCLPMVTKKVLSLPTFAAITPPLYLHIYTTANAGLEWCTSLMTTVPDHPQNLLALCKLSGEISSFKAK